jgi:hypothetical protein
MAVKIDTLEKVPPHVAIAAGLGGLKTVRVRFSKFSHPYSGRRSKKEA